MSASKLFVFISCTFILAISEYIMCNETHHCQNQILQCLNDDEECHFMCSNAYGCWNSTLICPPAVTSCTVQCNNHYSCHSANIICSRNSECNIFANGKYSLAHSKINGPYKQITNMECNDDYACKEAWIDARHSIRMTLMCDTKTQYDACSDITLYCPYYEEITDEATCSILQTEDEKDGIQRGTHETLSIYAHNSWEDLQIAWNVIIGAQSKMYCGDNYRYQCLIQHKQSEWNCADHTSYCYMDRSINEQNSWKHIWSGRTIATIVFVCAYGIVLLLSCRYGHRPNTNRKEANLIEDHSHTARDGMNQETKFGTGY